jgi:hypothetical protein
MAQAMAPHTQANEQRIGGLEQRLNQVVDMLSRSQQPQQPNGQPNQSAEGRDTKLERFVADPDAYERDLIGKATKAAAAMMAPYIAGPASDVQERTFAAEAARIDAKYGANTFNEVVRPRLESALGHMAEPLRYNPEALRTATSALIGSAALQPVLDERQATHLKAQAERADKARLANKQKPPNFLGSPRGNVDGDGRPVIGPEDRLVLEKLSEAGFKMDEAEMRAIKSVPKGVSLEDQLAAYEKAMPRKGAAA